MLRVFRSGVLRVSLGLHRFVSKVSKGLGKLGGYLCFRAWDLGAQVFRV